MDINTVTLTGRSTKDVELRSTNSGTNVATISLAVNGMKEEVSFFDVICFGKTAEVVSQYAGKGKQLGITGRLQQSKWTDKDGNNRYSVEVVASQVKLLGGKDESNRPITQNEVLEQAGDFVPKDIEDKPITLADLPF